MTLFNVGRRKIGEIGVDSGQVVVTDPCYLKDWKDGHFEDGAKPDNDYARCCVASLKPEGGGEVEGRSAVCSSTGWGDGSYPVYVEYDRDGRVARLIVEFDEEYEPEEEEEE